MLLVHIYVITRTMHLQYAQLAYEQHINFYILNTKPSIFNAK